MFSILIWVKSQNGSFWGLELIWKFLKFPHCVQSYKFTPLENTPCLSELLDSGADSFWTYDLKLFRVFFKQEFHTHQSHLKSLR